MPHSVAVLGGDIAGSHLGDEKAALTEGPRRAAPPPPRGTRGKAASAPTPGRGLPASTPAGNERPSLTRPAHHVPRGARADRDAVGCRSAMPPESTASVPPREDAA